MARELKPCGTRAAYKRHHDRGEQACDACNAANNAYNSEYRKAITRIRRKPQGGK